MMTKHLKAAIRAKQAMDRDRMRARHAEERQAERDRYDDMLKRLETDPDAVELELFGSRAPVVPTPRPPPDAEDRVRLANPPADRPVLDVKPFHMGEEIAKPTGKRIPFTNHLGEVVMMEVV